MPGNLTACLTVAAGGCLIKGDYALAFLNVFPLPRYDRQLASQLDISAWIVSDKGRYPAQTASHPGACVLKTVDVRIEFTSAV
jgi:hypothetical protein